jgi:hypothetical protein
MSNDTNTGGPAFPVSEYVQHNGLTIGTQEGMTLRDYFAAKAMQGMLADPDTARTVRMSRRKLDEAVSELSYMFADAMIQARNQ